MFTAHRPQLRGRFFLQLIPPFHFDALVVSLAKHRPSLSEIPVTPATFQPHFSATRAHIFAHFSPHFPSKTAFFIKFRHFCNIHHYLTKNFFCIIVKKEKVGTALA
jgi:hypothetical protein